MKVTILVLWIVVIIELAVGASVLALASIRTVPQLPDVELNDPLVMPQLRELAQEAEASGSEEWERLGAALVGKGFYVHAEPAYREALRQDPQNFAAQFGLAFSLDRSGRIEKASAEYRKLLQLPTPSREDQAIVYHAQYALGRNALRTENAADAEFLFQQNAGYPPADYQVAKLRIRSGRAEEALPIIESNLRSTPHSLEFHFLHHRALLELGRPREAFEAAAMEERSTRLLALNFNTEYVSPLDALTGLAPMLRALGMATETEDVRRIEQIGTRFKSRLAGQPVFVERMVDDELLKVAVRNKQPRRVLELLEQIRSTGREDHVTLEREGDARGLMGQAEAAAELWQRAALLAPSLRLHEKLADHYKTRDVDERDRHLGHVALQRGIAEYRANRLEAAIPHLQEAARMLPEDPDPWYYLAEMQFHLGRLSEAQDAYRKTFELDPGHGRAAAMLSHLAAAPENL
ncbi:tetratricopeptide repeat protein [Candidatus Laterigemmans baculatus]|uniref:tetratricopeptide repeat protein n=1 Tax=Candidatus Laterigemmans baculatus TaxID=2770505 RepID=UPI0013DA832B|nr:tetratricopeptide repeat protein [Candidatus Laterigemmans baculatus]